MRALLVYFTAFAIILTLSMPAVGAWTFQDDFESYAVGDRLSDHGYGPATGPSLVVAGDVSNKYATQVPGQICWNYRDLREGPFGYAAGWARFWVYDPVPGSGSDTRVGIHSSLGADSTAKLMTSSLIDNYSTNCWTANWSFSNVTMDGMSAPSETGYAFTAGPAASRHLGWNYTTLTWSFNYATSTGHIEWRVNTTATPNLTLDFNSDTSRWASFHETAGIYLGSFYTSPSVPAGIDNIQFNALTLVPEPSSLAVLGAGLLSLAGLRFRRK